VLPTDTAPSFRKLSGGFSSSDTAWFSQFRLPELEGWQSREYSLVVGDVDRDAARLFSFLFIHKSKQDHPDHEEYSDR
jgi:hypothetical protein